VLVGVGLGIALGVELSAAVALASDVGLEDGDGDAEERNPVTGVGARWPYRAIAQKPPATRRIATSAAPAGRTIRLFIPPSETCGALSRLRIAYLKMIAMLLKSAHDCSKTALLTQYCVPCQGSLTRTWLALRPLSTTECSSSE
jgi:hypothetical protein